MLKQTSTAISLLALSTLTISQAQASYVRAFAGATIGGNPPPDGTLVTYDSSDGNSPSPLIATAHTQQPAQAHAVTGLGYGHGAGSLSERYSHLNIDSFFRIDNLTLSYVGTGTAESTITGNIHLSYASSMTSGHAPGSTFTLKMDTPAGYRTQSFTGYDIDGNTGVWSQGYNFTVGSTFSLSAGAELSIATAWDGSTGTVIPATGSYSIFLGGSPVFNLPDGYVVNSADGTIVDNYFTGPSSHTVVPVPAAAWLFGSGLLSLIGFARRKKAHI